MSVLKYKDSSGNWKEVGLNTEGSGGEKLYLHYITLNQSTTSDGILIAHLIVLNDSVTQFTFNSLVSSENVNVMRVSCNGEAPSQVSGSSYVEIAGDVSFIPGQTPSISVCTFKMSDSSLSPLTHGFDSTAYFNDNVTEL